MSHLTEENLKELKEQLEKEAGELEARLKNLEKNPEFGNDVESDFSGEEADEAEEFSNQLGLQQALKERNEDVQRALEKIEKGAYGHCEKCEKGIDLELLKVNPESKLCKNCKVSN